MRLEILADGRLVYSKDLQVGQSAALNVPVSNVLQREARYDAAGSSVADDRRLLD
jgi:hypothetical protein